MKKAEARKIERELLDKAIGSVTDVTNEQEYESAIAELELKADIMKGLIDGCGDRGDVFCFYGWLACVRAIHYFRQNEITKIDQRLLSYAM